MAKRFRFQYTPCVQRRRKRQQTRRRVPIQQQPRHRAPMQRQFDMAIAVQPIEFDNPVENDEIRPAPINMRRHTDAHDLMVSVSIQTEPIQDVVLNHNYETYAYQNAPSTSSEQNILNRNICPARIETRRHTETQTDYYELMVSTATQTENEPLIVQMIENQTQTENEPLIIPAIELIENQTRTENEPLIIPAIKTTDTMAEQVILDQAWCVDIPFSGTYRFKNVVIFKRFL